MRPTFVLDTEFGPIVLELRPDRAPVSTAAFQDCLVRNGFRGARFFRAVRPDNDLRSPPIAVLQVEPDPACADRDRVAHEATSKTGLRHLDGVVSLARGAPGTASPAGFFICIGDQPSLDQGGRRCPDGQGFAAFGRVLEGMEVVRRIWLGAVVADPARPPMGRQLLSKPVPFEARRVRDGLNDV